jgi:two-component system, NarL family, response regulator LiaR
MINNMRHTPRSLLAEQRHWKIHEAADGKAALTSVRKLKPDVVVMDIVMPVMNGIAATYELRHFAPETKVVLTSSHYTPEEAAILARLFGDGTFVTKAAAGKDLGPAISRSCSSSKALSIRISQ